jgi:hypothetical protein
MPLLSMFYILPRCHIRVYLDSLQGSKIHHCTWEKEMTTNQVSENDLCFLRELHDSRTGISARYEIADMYQISVVELELQVDGLDDAAVNTLTSGIESVE